MENILTLLCCLWVALSVVNGTAHQRNIYLTPSGQDLSKCPSNDCYTIDDFSENYPFKPNTRLMLLPGTHTVYSNNSMIFVQNIENFTMVGWHANANDTIVNDHTHGELHSVIECTTAGRFAIVFRNVTNVKMSHVIIRSCSQDRILIMALFNNNQSWLMYNVNSNALNLTIMASYSTNVTIDHVIVSHGLGIGILLEQVYEHLVISYSVFTNNTANCHFIVDYSKNVTEPLINISFSEFSYGDMRRGYSREGYLETSGIAILVKTRVATHVHLFNVSVICNHGFGTSTNLYIQLKMGTPMPLTSSQVNIERLYSTNTCKDWSLFPTDGLGLIKTRTGIATDIFIANSCFESTSIHVSALTLFRVKGYICVTISNVKFQDILSMWPQLDYALINFWKVSRVTLETVTFTNVDTTLIQSIDSEITLKGNNTFQGNKGGIEINKGSTLTFDTNSSTRFMDNICMNGKSDQFTCSICNISDSQVIARDGSYVLFQNNTAKSSITLNGSTIKLYAGTDVTFHGNKGEKGAAMSFYSGSKLTISFCIYDIFGLLSDCHELPFTNITFMKNHATQVGGAIFVEDTSYIDSLSEQLSQYFVEFEPCGVLQCVKDQWRINANFVNNSATIAGSTLYGGWYDLNSISGHLSRFIHFYGKSNDHSVVSSNPVRVCVCISTTPICNVTEYTVEVYKGQTVEIHAVVVGQRFGTVPAIVHAKFNSVDSQSNSSINGGQYVQSVTKHCTALRYTVLSANHKETLLLTTERIGVPTNSLKALRGKTKWAETLLSDFAVHVAFKNCPAGFAINEESNRCVCHPLLVENGIDNCDIKTERIQKDIQMWVNATFNHIDGNTTSGVIIHKHCPYDYCQVNSATAPLVSINLREPNEQCAHNRSGVLCGACQSNFSHVLGSSRCKMCSSLWVLLLIPTIALAGVVLIAFLICLNMTVSIGAINGLLFYANIVRTNHNVFFTGNTVLSVFISWLNLDLGIEVCLYHNLDAYTKTWLQFVFPLYIWFIVIFIIVSSHYSTTAARMCGTNVVSVLATLFLMSYAKLLRVFITVFQPMVLVYPDGYHREVWHYDGNVEYLKGKHIPLFTAALLLLLILTIPYTTSLIFIQCLRKINHLPILFWVRKLKPLFDAHTGPYKDNHCYWTGLLLLVRVALFTVFSVNVSGDASTNLLAIELTILCLFAYLSLVGGVYRSWLINSLEVFSYLNIGILTAATYFYRSTPTPKITNTSVGIALCSFMFITVYHIYLRITSTHRGEKLVKTLKSKLKNTYPSQAIVTLITPVPKTPTSHSSIELQESLLDEVHEVQ